MRRTIPFALGLAVLLVALAPATAIAADVTEYQLQLSPMMESGTSQMIVTAVLDPTASLPATVSIPVPAGAELLWSGELLGGDADSDPFRQATVERVGAMDVYTFAIEQSYVGQVEVTLGAPKVKGSTLSASVTWVNPGAEALVNGAVVAEPGARKVEISPNPTGSNQTNDAGETLYPLETARIAEGGTYVITASWRRPGGGLPVVSVLLGLLAVVIVTLVLVLVRERTRARLLAEQRAARRAESRWE